MNLAVATVGAVMADHFTSWSKVMRNEPPKDSFTKSLG
jgi:hypothetical protein